MKRNFFKITILFLSCVFISIFTFFIIIPKLNLNANKIKEVIDLPKSQESEIKRDEYRTTRVKINSEEILKDTFIEGNYEDIVLYSTQSRRFSEKEMKIIKKIIDELPEELFKYRPWGIISTNEKPQEFKNKSINSIAFAGGPYIFVSDSLFKKELETNNGTYLGIKKTLIHEIVHTAQFFTIEDIQKDDPYTLLDSQMLTSWIDFTGWKKEGENYKIGNKEKTTEYGKTNPAEDMADSISGILSGQSYLFSSTRLSWTEAFLKKTDQELSKGTLPTNANLVEIQKNDNDEDKLFENYKSNYIHQDLIKFQSLKPKTLDELKEEYTKLLQKRGWEGNFGEKNQGEFKYKDKYEILITIDDSQLKVISIILNVI